MSSGGYDKELFLLGVCILFIFQYIQGLNFNFSLFSNNRFIFQFESLGMNIVPRINIYDNIFLLESIYSNSSERIDSVLLSQVLSLD